jgi:tetratricopeptide (TPR) repeat protein
MLGRYDEALKVLSRTLAIRERVAPGGNDWFLRNRIASALRKKREFAAALEADRRSEKDVRRYLPPDFPRLPAIWASQAEDLLGLGRPAEALPLLERALERRLKDPPDNYEPASFRLDLARALWESGGNHARARALGVQARDAFALVASQGAGLRSAHEEAAEWVEQHR